jgi:DNA-binding NarL/FixJ family response regulator
VRIVVAEDSVLFRAGLVRLLESEGFEVVAEAGDAMQLEEAVDSYETDLAIIDVRMPPSHSDEGLVAAVELRARRPATAVLVLSHHVESRQAMRLLKDDPTGVGYLLKDRVTDVADFVDSVRRVAAGGCVIDPEVIRTLLDAQRHRREDWPTALTQREREVLALMAEGRTNQAIGESLHVGSKTIESHVGNIFTKLGLLPAPNDHRRVLAVLAYLRSM